MGFGKRGKTSFTVHRSEEVLPGDVRLSKQGSSASSDGEGSADGDRLSFFYILVFIQSLKSKHVDRYIERRILKKKLLNGVKLALVLLDLGNTRNKCTLFIE